MDRPRSRPLRLSECVGGLSGAGALLCLVPPFMHLTVIGIDLGKTTLHMVGLDLSRDNLDENGGGNQSLKRRPVAML